MSRSLEIIKEQEPKIHAFLTVDEEGAYQRAKKLEERLHRGEDLPLAGVPMAVKDNICVQDLPMTCGSRILQDYRPPYTATAVERLEKAGAILVGKTNLDEFAMGNTTEHSAYGVTKNPWDLTRVPGGSSGGSAAAVAAGEVPFALGSDTGGSVRNPASYCGLVGLKPTYGTVSRYGLTAFASSLEQIGPLTRTVEDCAALYGVLAGSDRKDATSRAVPEKEKDSGICRTLQENQRKERLPLQGLRVGIPSNYCFPGLAPAVARALQKAGKQLEEAGAQVEYFILPLVEEAVPAYYVLSSAQASSNLARFDGVRFGHRSADYENLRQLYEKSRSLGFGKEVKSRILLGTFVLTHDAYDSYYLQAKRVQEKIKGDMKQALSQYHLILGPTTPTTAPLLGEEFKEPALRYFSDIYTCVANLTGQPALSIPFGTDEAGLPIGLQLMGPDFSEALLF